MEHNKTIAHFILTKPTIKKRWILPVFALFLFLVFSAGKPVEYTLKALYVEKFTRFINWPANTDIEDTEAPFIIAVLGDTPLKETLHNIFSIQKIYEKPVEVEKVNSVDQLENCHMLFIASDQKLEIQNILKKVQRKPILTIGDTPGYAEEGVLINFFFHDENLRFEINESALKKSPLEINFHLLNMAKIISPVDKMQTE